MTLPKISVITLSYNQGQYLEETIKSVLAQNYPSLEYIIMDGGSTDCSIDIIKKYADKLAFWQSKPDGGQSAAITDGFQKASGEIFCWLNSDDVFLPGALLKVGEYFAGNPDCQWLAGAAIAIDKDGKKINLPTGLNEVNGFIKFWLWGKQEGSYISQPSVFWTKDLWNLTGGYCRDDKPNSMDYELWLRFNNYTNVQLIQDILSSTRLHDECKSVMNRVIQRKEVLASAKEYSSGSFGLKLNFMSDWEKLHFKNLLKAIRKYDCKNILKYCLFIASSPIFFLNDSFCLFMWERFRNYENLYRPQKNKY